MDAAAVMSSFDLKTIELCKRAFARANRSGGRMSAGRGFIHLAPDGRIEACPFAPFSDCSAARSSLAEALESPLMRAIRERHHEPTESGGGCALANKGGWIASLSACAAKPVEIGAA